MKIHFHAQQIEKLYSYLPEKHFHIQKFISVGLKRDVSRIYLENYLLFVFSKLITFYVWLSCLFYIGRYWTT